MSERTIRVSSLIRELAATFIRNEANPSPLITVTGVTVSPDLAQATVLVSVFPESGEDDALIFLTRKGSAFRSFAKRKMHTKTIPFFSFAIDYGEKHRQHFDEVLNKEKDADESEDV